MKFFSGSLILQNPYEFNTYARESFFGIPFLFTLYKSGIAGQTFAVFRMDTLRPDYDEEYERMVEVGDFELDNNLYSLRLNTIRYAYECSICTDIPF